MAKTFSQAMSEKFKGKPLVFLDALEFIESSLVETYSYLNTLFSPYNPSWKGKNKNPNIFGDPE